MQTNHTALKETARKLLREMGFKDSEIFEEYSIKTREMKEGFRVDVVGITEGRKVAVECGLTKADKLAWLKLFFDDVIVLPFIKLETDTILLQRRIRELEEKNASLVQQLKTEHDRYIQTLNSSTLMDFVYAQVSSLLASMTGKPKLNLAGWDYHLGQATDSLFYALGEWKECYEALKQEAKKTKDVVQAEDASTSEQPKP